ncbi:restriction endonuclease subunit S [Marinomonas aquiplantarum]|uniref:Type I restriction enzyme S subunit n=1 Tax=Marinomonas aquiplantarum TaxID=491951 RepID=A0A366CVS9_9GAMM|nr:restriction endonuclease subunit S [Marinomonas aquiplantarum]RBO79591.1 type I restriction enzyme S subunit [Marinomonas aquiplantarum]
MIKLGCNDSLPSGWVWAKANDVMDVRDGTHDSPKALATGIPLVTSKNLVNGEIDYSTCTYISEEDHESISKRSAVDDGDILYAMIGTIGNPVIVRKDFDFSIKNVALFKFANSDLCNRYIYHYLNCGLAKQQFQSNSRGGTQKFVSLGNIRELMIPLPPLEEQKRIAAILDKADAIRRKRQQAIDLADEFLRSVFLDMFGDPVTNPKGWEVKSVEEVSLKVTDGVHAKPNYADSGIPFISVKNIIGGRISFDDTKFISLEDHIKYSKRCNVEKRDIVYTKVGATYGRAALVETDTEFSLYVSVALIKPNHNLIDARFLTEVMNSSSVKRQADRSIKGAGVPDLHLVEIKSFLIPVPDLNTQRGFVSKVNGIYKKVERYKKTLFKLDELFNSLSQKAFSGQL